MLCEGLRGAPMKTWITAIWLTVFLLIFVAVAANRLGIAESSASAKEAEKSMHPAWL